MRKLRSATAGLLLSALCATFASRSYAQATPPSKQEKQAVESKLPVMKSHARMGYQDYATKKAYDILLDFESGVREENGRFRYFYSFFNKGETPVRLEWKYIEASEFATNPKELKKLYGWLKPGESRSSVHESKTPPQGMQIPVYIYVKGGSGFDARVGSVGAGTYVPNTVR